MKVIFAFTNTLGEEYESFGFFRTGVVQNTVTEFTIDCANLDPPTATSARPFIAELLDGQKWELPVRSRFRQKLSTHANLALAGVTIGSDFFTYQDLLRRWYFARARWIKTDDLNSASLNRQSLGAGFIGAAAETFVKVVRPNEELAFEQVDGVDFAIKCDIEVETAYAYDSFILGLKAAKNGSGGLIGQ